MNNLMLSTQVLVTKANGEKVQGQGIFFVGQYREKFYSIGLNLQTIFDTLVEGSTVPHLLDSNDELIEDYDDVEFNDSINELNSKLYWG